MEAAEVAVTGCAAAQGLRLVRAGLTREPQVCPIALKYNKIFVDAFWNSRREAFGKHLFRLLTSWALVCDVYFLEPQSIRPGALGRAVKDWREAKAERRGIALKSAGGVPDA